MRNTRKVKKKKKKPAEKGLGNKKCKGQEDKKKAMQMRQKAMEMFGETRNHKDLEDVEEKCKGKNNETDKLTYGDFSSRKSGARYQKIGEKRGSEKRGNASEAT